MRKRNVALIGLVCLILAPYITPAQSSPTILVVQKRHFDYSKDFSGKDWQAAEKEFFDKVIAKDDLIKGHNLLVHLFTPDATEVVEAFLYDSWEDIGKDVDRTNELVRQAWPDSVKRRAFFDKLNSFYTRQHSDEIYNINANLHFKMADTSAHIYYVRTQKRAFPADGKPGEIMGLLNEHYDNVLAKNDLLKGYYIYSHLYGTDSRDVVEVFVYNSLADLEKSPAVNQELVKKHWPDENKLKEASAAANKYFEPGHGDAIYRSIPGFIK